MKNEFILKTLLSRVAKGDYASFRELFDIQYATVNRFVGYFLPNKEDREEVVSEVFCILWKRREELIDIEDLNAWLFIISRNESFHYLKQKEHQRQNISIDELPIDLYIDTNEVDSDLLDAEMTEVYNKALSITEGTVEQQMNIAIRKMLDAVSRYYNVVKRRIHLLF